jgi:ferric-dicitrate binding protein FerR (iron transport regulator)
MRLWKKIVLGVLGVVVLLAAFVVWKMGPKNVYGLARYGTQREEGTLKVGQLAPDVSLVALDGKTKVRLSDSGHSKPLILVFGSYT